MKITKVETLVCHARMRNWVFVKVLTDQPGLFGLGESILNEFDDQIINSLPSRASLWDSSLWRKARRCCHADE